MLLTRFIGIAVVGAIAACSSSTSPSASPGPNQVFMQNTAFNPPTRTVSKGTTVQWVNQDGITHTVTKSSGPGAVFNGMVAGGGNFSVTFDSAGTYQYYCTIHGTPGAGMHGTVVVQ